MHIAVKIFLQQNTLESLRDFYPSLCYYILTKQKEGLPMPQMSKGGKFIFGKSLIQKDLTIHLPPQAVTEYDTAVEGKVYLFTGSKITGGFCVTRKGLLAPSKLGHILMDNPALQNYQTKEGEWIQYKGRFYCWVTITKTGILQFNQEMLKFLDLDINTELLSIRSSNIAFTMGSKGPLLEKAEHYDGTIPIY